jgi:uncharacterized phage protein (TIGR01671 family)
MNIPKFRAWLIESKVMLDVHTINFHDEEVYFGETEHGEEILLPFDEIILMQSTGFVDDYGTEIFEGDAMQYLPTSSDNCIAFVVWDSKKQQWALNNMGDYEAICKYESNNLQIFGNIHANPELLEQTK